LPLILASASPRRLELLARLGVVPLAVDPADIDEHHGKAELPLDYARRMAREKAEIVAARHPGKIVLGADTVVSCGRRILPKAEDEKTARQCLELLSGRRHRVISAVTVIDAEGKARHRDVTTIVAFKRLSDDELAVLFGAGRLAWQGRRLCHSGRSRSAGALPFRLP